MLDWRNTPLVSPYCERLERFIEIADPDDLPSIVKLLLRGDADVSLPDALNVAAGPRLVHFACVPVAALFDI